MRLNDANPPFLKSVKQSDMNNFVFQANRSLGFSAGCVSHTASSWPFW